MGTGTVTSIIELLLCNIYRNDKEFSRAVSPSTFYSVGRGDQGIVGLYYVLSGIRSMVGMTVSLKAGPHLVELDGKSAPAFHKKSNDA